jgi:hypothetical protein
MIDGEPGLLFTKMSPEQQQRLFENTAGVMGDARAESTLIAAASLLFCTGLLDGSSEAAAICVGVRSAIMIVERGWR